jgi:hypothetical protein
MAFLEYRPNQTLFQYCSPDSFFGILRSKRLWFSDLASANDPREIRLGYQHFVDAIKLVQNEEYRGERGSFLSVLAEHLAWRHRTAQAFCCCFSLAVDYLPMWGAYGANYGGLAVGFRPTAVFDMPARVQKVKYVNENTATDFRALVLEIAAQFDTIHAPSDLNFWIPAAAYAFAAITALKHTTWEYEREIRVVHSQTKQPPDKNTREFLSNMGLLPDYEPDIWVTPLERSGRTGVVSYLDLPFGRVQNGSVDPTGAIDTVIIGPNCHLSPSEVTKAMQENGFKNFKITRSICEIR